MRLLLYHQMVGKLTFWNMWINLQSFSITVHIVIIVIAQFLESYTGYLFKTNTLKTLKTKLDTNQIQPTQSVFMLALAYTD